MSTVRRLEFATADPTRVSELLGRAYGREVRLLRVAPGAPVRHVRYDAGSFSVSEITIPGYLSYACEPENTVFVSEVTAGRVRLRCGRGNERLAAGRPILGAGGGVAQVFHSRDARIRQLTIGTDLIDSVAGARDGVSVEFRGFQPPSEVLARLWRQTAGYVAHVVRSQSADSPLVVAAAAHTVAAAVLVCFPNTVRSERDRINDIGPSGGLVRQAIAFVEANLDRDIGVADIAHAVHLTPRSVQLMFRRHLGTTPTGYLRRARLDQVHQHLLRADPASETVSRIAARWGFAHPGRFAARYRQAYGCAPNVTLHTC